MSEYGKEKDLTEGQGHISKKHSEVSLEGRGGEVELREVPSFIKRPSKESRKDGRSTRTSEGHNEGDGKDAQGSSDDVHGADIVKLKRYLQHMEKVFNCFVPSGYQVRISFWEVLTCSD